MDFTKRELDLIKKALREYAYELDADIKRTYEVNKDVEEKIYLANEYDRILDKIYEEEERLEEDE